MADFPTVRMPDFTQAVFGGYSAGRALGQQRRRDDALATYAQNPDAGIAAIEGVDPALADQLRRNKQGRDREAAYADLYAPQAPALGAPTSPPATGGQPALGAMPGAPAGGDMAAGAPALGGARIAPMAAPAAPMPQMTPEAAPVDTPESRPRATPPRPLTLGGREINMDALSRLAASGEDGFAGAQKLFELIKSEDEARIKQVERHADMRGALAQWLKTMPQNQRAKAYEEALPELVARGFIPQAVQGMRFDDSILDRDVFMAGNAKQAFEENRARQKEAADAAERATDNARADRGLAVREGALGLARRRAAGGGGTGGGDNSDLNYLLGGE